jgi:hypothetical protein
MEKLNILLKEIEAKIDFREHKNIVVSESDVAWHLDHSLKVIIGVIATLKKTNPENYQWKFNFKRTVVMALNKFPRGKAKAPETLVSKGLVTIEDLKSQIELAKIQINDLSKLEAKNHFIHPFFGMLNLKQAIRFLSIHTNHHLKIIDDIIKK